MPVPAGPAGRSAFQTGGGPQGVPALFQKEGGRGRPRAWNCKTPAAAVLMLLQGKVEKAPLADALAEEGIPCLGLETDYADNDAEQLRTRIGAFIEMLDA